MNLAVFLTLLTLSSQMSVRKQLETSPPNSEINSRDIVPEDSPRRIPEPSSSLGLLQDDQNEQNKRSNGALRQSVLDVTTIDQILDLLRGDVTNGTEDGNSTAATIPEVPESEPGAPRMIALTTGNSKVDRLLEDLGKPTENSKAIWMALLHGLMSDGSLNELLGNFLQETRAAKREDPIAGQDGQEFLGQGELADQLEGVEGAIPQTQMEEFILEPHLGPAIMPFQLPDGFFVAFLPRRAFGVVNGVARPAHGHGSFYTHRPPGLVDVLNAPAYGYLFNGYRRFEPDAAHLLDDLHQFYDEAFYDDNFTEPPFPSEEPSVGENQ